jgi:uncharacterized protein YndB with AHSA1/START domain
MTTTLAEKADPRELTLERTLAAPRAAIWRCWTEPALMTRWFTPPPWRTEDVVVDLRPGGRVTMTMCGPDGERVPNAGVYLEVVPGARLVFTDAYVRAWEPAEKPFFTGIIELADAAGGTRYVARARHWTVEDAQRHAEMGFHVGWGTCADQLEALARTLGGDDA